MRGADTFTERLFTMRHLEDFVPADHPLRPIRAMVNETLLRAMLLQVRLQRALRAPDHGADPVQPAVSLGHR